MGKIIFILSLMFSFSAFAVEREPNSVTAKPAKEESLQVQKELKPTTRKKSQHELEAKIRSQLPGKASKTQQK